MKITVKADHLEVITLLIACYGEGVPPQGLLFEPSLTTGVLNRLSKIKYQCVSKGKSVKEVVDAIKVRNNITADSYNNQYSEEFKAFLKEANEVLMAPIELDFDPIDASFIDNIIISQSNIPDWLKSNPEYLSELLDIIKGDYVYPIVKPDSTEKSGEA